MPSFRGYPACSCLVAWLVVYERELLRRGLIKYNLDVFQLIGNASASAGTHSKGGCADLGQRSREQLRVARNMGAAAWERDADPNDGQPDFRPAHAHLSLKGCPHAVKIARDQVSSCDNGHNGLAGNGPDDGPRDGVQWPLRTWEEGIEWAKAQKLEPVPAPTPQPTTVYLSDPRITESSALALSVKHPGIAYTLNDENGPIFAIDLRTGKTVGTFTLKGVKLVDPESLDVAPNGGLWIADVGDNEAKRKDVALYVLAEPGPGNHGALAAEKYVVAYPNGPRNAETFCTHPRTGHRYIVSKQASGNLYRADKGSLALGRRNVLKQVGAKLPAYVTEAKFSIDGRFVFCRQKDRDDTVTVLDGETWRTLQPFKVPKLGKPESLDVDPDGLHIWIGSEGKNSPLHRVALPGAYRPKAEAPAGAFDADEWKATLPIGKKGKPTELYPVREAAPWIRREGGAWIFRANHGGVTTSGSRNPRSELREMIDGDLAEWDARKGRHRLDAELELRALTHDKPHVVMAQIHDEDDDVTVLRAEGRTDQRNLVDLWLTKGDKSHAFYVDRIELGQRFDFSFLVSSGVVRFLYEGASLAFSVPAGGGAYFKTGCYLQSNPESAPNEDGDAFAEVVVYRAKASHS